MEPHRGSMKAIIQKIGYDYDINVVELEISEDHINMVVESELKTSPSQITQVVKSISAREFFRMSPEIKKRYFWGGKFWAQSYVAENIGNANEDTIIKYAQEQLEDLDMKERAWNQLGLF